MRRLAPARLPPVLTLIPLPAAAEADTPRVMSFNLRGAGASEGKRVEETIAAIRAAGADIVGVQETRARPETCTATDGAAAGESRAKALAGAPGWTFRGQTADSPAPCANAVISRFPIAATTPGDPGVRPEVDGRAPVAVTRPATQRPAGAGFLDTSREIRPDSTARPADTWTPRHPEDAADNHRDRIALSLRGVRGWRGPRPWARTGRGRTSR